MYAAYVSLFIQRRKKFQTMNMLQISLKHRIQNSPCHVGLNTEYVTCNVRVLFTSVITKAGTQGKSVLESLYKSVVGEVEGGGRGVTEVVVHDVEEKEEERAARGSRCGVDGVT